MQPIIEVKNISKRYVIGAKEDHGTLREEIMNVLSSPFRHRVQNADDNIFWALSDVSFDVCQGEVLGIIGRNGAGKSTLLKILSRITEPTSGRVTMKGKVASLLEVGTGFHPELTGRENIFLNGALLGMRRAEIKSKFDEIVAFSEIEKFLDTPVKRYSSGMHVRLAFAVAAHLEPEILIVDEVLAVGDAAFQKKCLGKMGDVAKGGRTVLFVSHNMGVVSVLCQKCVLLEEGKIISHGMTDEIIQKYLSNVQTSAGGGKVDLSQLPRTGKYRQTIQEAWIENNAAQVVSDIPMGAATTIRFRFKSDRVLIKPTFGLTLYNSLGQAIFSFASHLISKENLENRQKGTVSFIFNEFPLMPGGYMLTFGIAEFPYQPVDYVEMVLPFSVTPYDYFGTGNLFESSHGVVFLKGKIRLD